MVEQQIPASHQFSFAQGYPGEHGKWRCCGRDEQRVESKGAKLAAPVFSTPPESSDIENDGDHQRRDGKMRRSPMHASPEDLVHKQPGMVFNRVLHQRPQGCGYSPHNSPRLYPRRWEEPPARLSSGLVWVLRRARVVERRWMWRCGK